MLKIFRLNDVCHRLRLGRGKTRMQGFLPGVSFEKWELGVEMESSLE